MSCILKDMDSNKIHTFIFRYLHMLITYLTPTHELTSTTTVNHLIYDECFCLELKYCLAGCLHISHLFCLLQKGILMKMV